MDVDKAKRDRLQREQWKRRRQMICCIDFDRIAVEVNRIRLRDLNAKLMDPEQARRSPRLAKLQWPLKSLPTDLKADAGRMRRTLLALHEIIGRNHSFRQRVAIIGERMGASAETAERGVRDLRECHLVDVKARVGDRQEDGTRRRRDRVGGRGPSEYKILWASIADEATSRGAQPALDLHDEDDSVAGGSGGPDVLSGRGQPGGDRAPHGEGSLPHGEGSLPHGEGSLSRRARAISPSRSSSKPPPPVLPQAEEADDWTRLRTRLAAYGVGCTRVAIREARIHGWTAPQVAQLLDECERLSFVDTDGSVVRAHPPGRVYTQLVSFEPGTRIALAPAPGYVEAQRARQQRELRRADQAREQQQQEERESRFRESWEALEALDPEALHDACLKLWHPSVRKQALQAIHDGRDPRDIRAVRLALSSQLNREVSQ